MRFHHIYNLAITTAMVCVIGCASQKKQSSPVTINNPDAGAAFLRLIAAEDAKNPILPDDDLIASFQKHRTTFEQLQQMIATDYKLHRVDEDWTDPRDAKDAGISPSRIAEYRRLLTEVGCRRGFDAFTWHKGIYFISAAQGTVVASQDQGYYYYEGTPDPVVTNTASYRAEQTLDSYKAYRHIDGHWYVYYARN
jgi:hypothetical protein